MYLLNEIPLRLYFRDSWHNEVKWYNVNITAKATKRKRDACISFCSLPRMKETKGFRKRQWIKLI